MQLVERALSILGGSIAAPGLFFVGALVVLSCSDDDLTGSRGDGDPRDAGTIWGVGPGGFPEAGDPLQAVCDGTLNLALSCGFAQSSDQWASTCTAAGLECMTCFQEQNFCSFGNCPCGGGGEGAGGDIAFSHHGIK